MIFLAQFNAGMQSRIGTPLLLMGLIAFSAGILLVLQHRRAWLQSYSGKVDSRTRLHEDRKFRRRAVLACLISSSGCIMAAMYWLTDPRLWALMMAILILMLVGVLGVAFFDLLSMGLRQIAEPDVKAQQAMVKKYLELREREKNKSSSLNGSSPGASSLDTPETPK